jgi:hypothetical protein
LKVRREDTQAPGVVGLQAQTAAQRFIGSKTQTE